MPQVIKAYLGLGANLGDPIDQLVRARRKISEWSEITGVESSFFYVSSPVGYTEQNDFVNCVLEVETSASSSELHAFTKALEMELGRERDPSNQNAPRLIDIDILLYGEDKIDGDQLTIPHPRMEQRLFVLLPLLELVDNGREGYQELAEQLLKDGEQSIFCLRVSHA